MNGLNRGVVNRSISSALLFAVVFALSACASSGTSRHGAEVAIRDVQSVAGRWAGIVEASGRNQDDFVEFTLNGDGTYVATGARTIGAFEGRGRVDVDQGRLRITSERSTGVGKLYEKDGKRTLVVDIVMTNGRQFTGRLTPR
jgi:hypothetical protein